jgi:Zn-dependent protease with chaperone function
MSDWERITGAVLRMPRTIIVALLATWTAVVVALWLALLGGLAAVVVLLVQAATGEATSVVIFNVHTGGVLTFASVIAAFVAGVAGGFVAVYGLLLVSHPSEVASSLLTGAVVAAGISWVALVLEPRLLQLRGYRTPSRREFEGTIGPALMEVAEAMGLDVRDGGGRREGGLWLPLILVSDTPIPQAWTHGRTIVITKGMMEGLDPTELQAVLCHEMNHWRMGDGIAMRMVAAVSWPLVLTYNLVAMLTGVQTGTQKAGQKGSSIVVKTGPPIVTVIAWIVLWPIAFLIRWVIVPLSAAESRRIEYEADAGVAAAGMGAALIRALERLPPFEAGRTAWETALTRTHPPIEHRIDHLERLREIDHPPAPVPVPMPAAPAAPSKRAIRVVLVVAVVLLLISLSPLVTGGGSSAARGARGERGAISATTAQESGSTIAEGEPTTTAQTTTTHAATSGGAASAIQMGAVDAAAAFAGQFYTDIFMPTEYRNIIGVAAAPGDAATLLSTVEHRFAADAAGKESTTANALVMADRVVSATPSSSPTQATVELWVKLSYAVSNGSTTEAWATAPYTLELAADAWKISGILTATTGPTPEQLHGATVPSGFSRYTAPNP